MRNFRPLPDKEGLLQGRGGRSCPQEGDNSGYVRRCHARPTQEVIRLRIIIRTYSRCHDEGAGCCQVWLDATITRRPDACPWRDTPSNFISFALPLWPRDEAADGDDPTPVTGERDGRGIRLVALKAYDGDCVRTISPNVEVTTSYFFAAYYQLPSSGRPPLAFAVAGGISVPVHLLHFRDVLPSSRAMRL
jgi:hypothetical protein